MVTMDNVVVVAGRVQRVVLTDRAPPHRTWIIWNVLDFGMSLAEARRARGRIHRDVEQARADHQATQLLVAGDFNLDATAAGRRSRADLHWAVVARMVPDFVPDAPSRWDVAIGRSTTIDRVFASILRMCPPSTADRRRRFLAAYCWPPTIATGGLPMAAYQWPPMVSRSRLAVYCWPPLPIACPS